MRETKPGNAASWVTKLQKHTRVQDLSPVAVRFVFSLRLIAVYRKAKHDPVPELAVKLGNINSAIHALELVETIGAVWPDPVLVSRACCHCLTHDELTLGRALEAAADRDRNAFDKQLEGLIKPRRIDALWEQALSLIAAEFNSA